MTTPDEFAQKFDAIDIARAPLRADEPGFYLVDDAGGRFLVDREFGVVSLRDEALLERERGSVHDVKLRVVEPTGDTYVLDLTLRVTGLVPQMVGAEDFRFGASSEAAAPPSPTTAIVPWTQFSPVRGRHAARSLPAQGAYGALVSTPLPASNEHVVIAFGETIPAPSPAHADWSL